MSVDVKVLAAFIRSQAHLTAGYPHKPGPGDVRLNHEEALLAADALDAFVNEGWYLPRHWVNAMQINSINKLISTAKNAHFVDVHMRVNGEKKQFQADWIKHLIDAPQRPRQEAQTPPAPSPAPSGT